MPYVLLLIPAAFAMLRLITSKYIFSALTTLSCAALALPRAPWIGVALIVSAAGDWFMAHKGAHQNLYRIGILLFLAGHLLFLVHSLTHARRWTPALIAGAALAIVYAVYLRGRVLPRVPKLLRVPAIAYTVISVVSFSGAAATGNALYIIGLGLLLFSDTLIAEHDFLRVHAAGAGILPTYYLCQILVALSALLS